MTMKAQSPHISDYFAELYVAGRLADAGWNVYFPHRDHGFDFIITKYLKDGQAIIRPVQVKGKYPQKQKTNKTTYGYTGRLSQIHPQMVLAIPFFSTEENTDPICVAYMPYSQIKRASRGYRCHPATYRQGTPSPRRDYVNFFDSEGIRRLEII